MGETLDTLDKLGPLPERISVHLDRGYDSEATRRRLRYRGLEVMISKKGKPAPLQATEIALRSSEQWALKRYLTIGALEALEKPNPQLSRH